MLPLRVLSLVVQTQSTNLWNERALLDVIQRHFLPMHFVPAGGERIVERPDALGWIILQNPLQSESVIRVDQAGGLSSPSAASPAFAYCSVYWFSAAISLRLFFQAA